MDEPREETDDQQTSRGGQGSAPTGATPSRLRYDRKRFMLRAGGFLAGLLAILGIGALARRDAPQGTVTSGTSPDLLADFPVRTAERDTPRVRPEDWKLVVDGLVDQPLTLDWAAWKAVERTDETVDFHCVEGWSVDDVSWGGVRLATLLDQAKPQAGAAFVTLYAYGDDYVDSLTMEEARQPSTLLADSLGGKALPPEHGGPLRAVVPTRLGYKNVKWVTRVELSAEQIEGYWEKRGYPVEAPIPEALQR
jgi:DMSO/TMAO reductase YedYZ molybdopterin-dependent catalytic subunit